MLVDDQKPAATAPSAAEQDAPPTCATAGDKLTTVAAAERAVKAASGRDSWDSYRKGHARRQATKQVAAEEAPVAIAAARHDEERRIISEVFAAIPGVIDLDDTHGRLEVEGTSTAEIDAAQHAWMAAADHALDLAEELVNLAPETAADAHRRFVLYFRMVHLIEARLDNDAVYDETGFYSEDLAVVGPAAMRALASLAQVEPDRSAWDAAMERHRRARAMVLALDEKRDEAEARADASVPKPPKECWLHEGGQPVRVLRAEDLSKYEIIFACIPPEEAKQRKDQVHRYWTDLREAKSREGVYAYDFHQRLAEREEMEAERALMATPAPDPRAVAVKVAVICKIETGHDLEAREPDEMRDAVEDVFGAEPKDRRNTGLVYRDLMTLAGEAYPPNGMEGFSGEDVVKSAVAAGAEVARGCLQWPDEALASDQAHIASWDHQSSWKTARVREAVKRWPRQHLIDQAIDIYGGDGAADWHGDLYRILDVCRDRWDLRLEELVAIRAALIERGYAEQTLDLGQ